MKKNQLLSHTAIYTLANLMVAGVPFILLPVLTRVLTPEAYGLISMFSLVVAFISIAVGLNIHGAIAVRYFDSSSYEIAKYTTAALCVICISSMLMFLVVFLIGEKLTELTSLPRMWLYVAVLVATLQFLIQLILTLWQASKKPVRYGALRISQALLDAIGSILLVAILAFSWQGRINSILISTFCIASITIYFLIQEGWIIKSIDFVCAKELLSFGVPLVPHALGGLLLAMADRFMVNSLLSLSSTGVYVVAVQLGLILGLLADSFNKAYAPWLMEKLKNINNQSQKKIVFFTYLYFGTILLLALLSSILTPYIVRFLIGPEYQMAGSILTYIFFGNAFIGMYYMVTNYIFYSGRTGLLSAVTIGVGVINLVVNWILIRSYGLEGAACAFMLGQAGLFIATWILANICFPMPWLKIITRVNML